MRTLKATHEDVIGIDIKPSMFTDRVGSITERSFVRDSMKGVAAVYHTATLHKPHVATHSHQEFIDVNITGTLNLLEEAVSEGVGSFIFTSTTSTFGDALTPSAGLPAAWITEEVVPVPKNIYGLTKIAAEDLCKLFYRKHRLPCLVLKTSRFFPEEDDRESIRKLYRDENAKANEFLYRRVDLEDVVAAHLLGCAQAPSIGFGRYIISATTPFTQTDLVDLHEHAAEVVRRHFPDYEEVYAKRGWKMFPKIERVYVNEKARQELGWAPTYDFRYVLDRLKMNAEVRSQLAFQVGSKGYHSEQFSEGPYPV
jgi:UDP-glucose 4-epimerase